VGIAKRQVFEASPPPPPRVVEYQVVARRCPGCGTLSYGQAPAWVSAPVQWGPSVHARAVLATLAHHLPYGRAALVLRQLAGLAVSVGFLVAARRRAAGLLEPFMARVRQLLREAGLLHVDETPPGSTEIWSTCTWPATSPTPRCTPAAVAARTSTPAGC
jgi:transposase